MLFGFHSELNTTIKVHLIENIFPSYAKVPLNGKSLELAPIYTVFG